MRVTQEFTVSPPKNGALLKVTTSVSETLKSSLARELPKLMELFLVTSTMTNG